MAENTLFFDSRTAGRKVDDNTPPISAYAKNLLMSAQALDEPILDDDYPVYGGYLYVADGQVLQSPVFGKVADLKRALGIKEVRRCDAARRNLL